MSTPSVDLLPITIAEAAQVAEFLHRTLNSRVSAGRWRALIETPWGDGPNHGYYLRDGQQRVVGAYVAIHSARNEAHVCNLAAFCVVEQFRAHSIRLMRAVLRQRGVVYTDLSPSGAVPAVNRRLGFSTLDTATRLVPNVGRLVRGVALTADPVEIAQTLHGSDAQIFADHRKAPAARHVLVTRGNDYVYLMYRRDRRKRLPLFASPLFLAGSPDVLSAAWPAVAAHLVRQGLLASLLERRIVDLDPPRAGHDLTSPRPKMFMGPVEAAQIDYLYSELTLVEW